MLFFKLTLVSLTTDINFDILFTKMLPIISNVELFLNRRGIGDVINHFCTSVENLRQSS